MDKRRKAKTIVLRGLKINAIEQWKCSYTKARQGRGRKEVKPATVKKNRAPDSKQN